MKVLLDHHMKRQGILLWSSLENQGWLALLDLPMLAFADVGLPISSSDREVWRFVQKNRLILLTANRNDRDEDSLQRTIWDENQPTSLPVVTISVLDRLDGAYVPQKMRGKAR
jgi:hypothetical protein